MSSVLDSLLDTTLDDLADLPTFAVFADGAHQVKINFEAKEVNKNPCIEMKLKLTATLEQSDMTETPSAPDTETNMLFQLNNEFGQGKLKLISEGIKTSVWPGEAVSLRRLVEEVKDLECVIVTKKRKGKKKDDGSEPSVFMDILKLEVM